MGFKWSSNSDAIKSGRMITMKVRKTVWGCAMAVMVMGGACPGFEDRLLSFAEEQAAAMGSGAPLKQFSVAFPETAAVHAETVQKHYVARRLADGESFAGIKGAVVGAGGQQMFGIEGPLSAVLFQSGWHEAGEAPTQIPVREDAAPGVETELGIILSKSIVAELADVDALRAFVEAVVPVIELPAGRHDWKEKPKAVDLIAANVDSDHYIVGKGHTDLSLDLEALKIRLLEGGAVRNETTGGDARNGQWWNFLHQVNWAVRQGYPLEPGHLVITGALGKIHRADSGSFRAEFGELGVIEFELVKAE